MAMAPSTETPPQRSHPVHDLPPITAARLQQGMSLNDLARAAQIDPAHLELMERGSHFASPTLAELERVAAILELTVDEIR
jgi:transcriptional regulator with XRE-family HTH domain